MLVSIEDVFWGLPPQDRMHISRVFLWLLPQIQHWCSSQWIVAAVYKTSVRCLIDHKVVNDVPVPCALWTMWEAKRRVQVNESVQGVTITSGKSWPHAWSGPKPRPLDRIFTLVVLRGVIRKSNGHGLNGKWSTWETKLSTIYPTDSHKHGS